MSFEDDSVLEIINKLRTVTADMTDEEKEKASLLVAYIKKLLSNKDYEGKQTFHFEDYKTRN